jgi:hypothetical protein
MRRTLLICSLLAALLLSAGHAGSALASKHPRASTLLLLGNKRIAPDQNSDRRGRSVAFRFRAVRSGVVSAIHLYLGRSTRAREVVVGVYADLRNHPGRLLTSGSLRHAARARWNSISVRSARVIKGRSYWIALLAPHATIVYRDRWRRSCRGAETYRRGLRRLPSRWRSGRKWDRCALSAYISGKGIRLAAGRGKPAGTSAPGGGAPSPTAPALRSSNCFPAPGACGFPDPSYGNVGVPPGTALTPSGDLVIQTPGTVINGLSISGPTPIDIEANNVTIENSKLTVTGGGCGTQTTCGNSDIRIGQGYSGTVLSHLELTTDASSTVEHAIRDTSASSSLVADHIYSHGPDAILYAIGGATVSNSYAVISERISDDHLEDIYCDGGSTITANHDTLINDENQVATLFCNTGGGSGGSCDNHVTMTNNLLAGGGFLLYECGNASSVGSATMNISNNRFARCLTPPIAFNSSQGGYACQGSQGYTDAAGADSHGIWPHGGYYGIDSETYCPPTAGATWLNNVWDDNNAAVGCQ